MAGGMTQDTTQYRWLLLVVLMGAAGCEKLPWTTSDTSTPTTPPQPTWASPPQPTVLPTDIIAKVNDKPISMRDVEFTITDLRSRTQALGQTWTPLPIEEQAGQYDLHDLLNDLIVSELRAQDAVARGLERNLDVQFRFLQLFRTFFAQEWLSWQLNRMTISQAEIDRFYQDNLVLFREPEQIRLRQLMVPTEDQAKSALVKLLEGLDFLALAQQISVRPEAAQGPLVEQWVMRSQEKAVFAPADERVRDLRDPVLEQAAFAIDKPGGVSSYVKGTDGNLHIFQLVERKPGRQKTLVEVSDGIRNFLQLQKLSGLTEELKTKAKLEQFPERLAGVQQ